MTNQNPTPSLMPRPGDPHGALGQVMTALDRLAPDELARLDAAITPEVAYLLVKAFGPGMGVVLWPLIVEDEGVQL